MELLVQRVPLPDKKELFPVTVYLRNLIAAATGSQEVTGGAGTDAVQIGANIQSVTMLLTVLPIICFYPSSSGTSCRA